MEKQEIIDNNNLINKFMGLDDNIPHDHQGVTPYHSDWNWLMKVIEKIEDIDEDIPDSKRNYHFYITKRFVGVVYDYECYSMFDYSEECVYTPDEYVNSTREYRYSLFDSKILAVYQAVVDFIKWYNDKNKQL